MKFKYKNDIIRVDLRLWFLATFFFQVTEPYYHSEIYDYRFYTFNSYWQEVGKRNALVQFISSRVPGKFGPKSYFPHEIAQRIARLDLGENPGIVIMNIDQSRLDRLMLMFAGVSPDVFKFGEMVVLPTRSKEAAYKLTQAIPIEMADVIAFSDGYMICDNNEGTG